MNNPYKRVSGCMMFTANRVGAFLAKVKEISPN